MESDSTSQRSFSPGSLMIVSLLVLVPAALLIMLWPRGPQSSGMPEGPTIDRYGMIGDFSLIDQRGEEFTRKDLDDKVWVANFIFTSCATECPLLSRRMRDVQDAFAGNSAVELVSISVDPRTDNPERLAKYASAFNAGERWSFLTGDAAEIKRLSTKGFMVTTPDEAPPSSSISRTREMLHSEKIAVVDQLGVVRYYANGMNPKAARDVISVVRKLLAQ